MQALRRSAERGYADHGWLQSRHSFSFADYHDPRHVAWGNLRVINEDRIAPGSGFGTHGHRDMEIVSIVLDGALAHRDDIAGSGHAGVLRPGDVQRMSAGRGVRHSEFNGDPDRTTHFLQIWIEPDARARGIAPEYVQKHFDPASMRGRFVALVSGDGARAGDGPDAPLPLHADATLYRARFDRDAPAADIALAPGRLAYVFVVAGNGHVNGQDLQAGDALLLRGQTQVHARATDGPLDVLAFDLAP